MLDLKFLFSEDGKTASLGRISFWIFSIVFLIKFIVSNQDIPSNFLVAYLSIVAYNFGKKTMKILEFRTKVLNLNNTQNNLSNQNQMQDKIQNQNIKLRSKVE